MSRTLDGTDERSAVNVTILGALFPVDVNHAAKGASMKMLVLFLFNTRDCFWP